MRGYVNIPNTMYVRRCKDCGARPIIALASIGMYMVKCPVSDTHYHTEPGLIDLENWNIHNINKQPDDYNLNQIVLTYMLFY
jgi:hypothetical protein